MKTHTHPVHRRHPRQAGGFTLIELIIVIAVIGILMALILPAISNAQKTARVAAVVTDIKSLENGLSNFKAKYGFYPPSNITLYETAAGWNSGGAAAHRAVIRRMFPNFSFGDVDFDGSGSAAGAHALNGNECLVFFLGGMPDRSGGNFAMTGFSKNPNNPFATGGNSRVGPFTEFQSQRLVDVFDGSSSGTNGFPEYVDPLPNQTAPYGYLSANDGRGYPTGSSFYRAPGEDANLNNTLETTEDANSNGVLDTGPAYKPESYQIVSPGFDTDYGAGGTYDPETADTKLGYDAEPSTRRGDRDNITNFHQGMLAN